MRSFPQNEAGWSRMTVFVFSSCCNTARTSRRIESELPPDVFIDLFNIPDSRRLIIIRSLSRQHSEWQELIVLERQPSVRRRSSHNPQCNGRCLQRPLGQKLFTLMSKSKYSNVFRIRTGVVLVLTAFYRSTRSSRNIRDKKALSNREEADLDNDEISASNSWQKLTKTCFVPNRKNIFKKLYAVNLYAVNSELITLLLISFQKFPNTENEGGVHAVAPHKSVLTLRRTYGCYKHSLTRSCTRSTSLCSQRHRLWQ